MDNEKREERWMMTIPVITLLFFALIGDMVYFVMFGICTLLSVPHIWMWGITIIGMISTVFLVIFMIAGLADYVTHEGGSTGEGGSGKCIITVLSFIIGLLIYTILM